jgi:uncharacterized protein (TIGR03790 family)
MYRILHQRPRLAWLAAALLCLGGLGLGPGQIALVVNQNSPWSLKLAKEYAAARHIPDGRIISLNVPDAEQMSFDDYERNVVPPIRQFLREHLLTRQVRCLVTFYGVPFRIEAKLDTASEREELIALNKRLNGVLAEIQSPLKQEEALAKQLDPNYKPPSKTRDETDVQAMAQRAATATQSILAHVRAMDDLDAKRKTMADLRGLISKLNGANEAALLEPYPSPFDHSEQAATQRQQFWNMRRDFLQATEAVERQEEKRFDPLARAAVRRLTAKDFGLVQLAEIINDQIEYLTPGTTNAALDNELALLWWNYYPRNGELENPLNFKVAGRLHTPPVIMVSRLDAPTPQIVSEMIQTSVQVERQGLRGCLALNSFGYPDHLEANGTNPYKQFDEKIRALGLLARRRTDLVVHEQYDRLFRDREVKNTALYCGWYSLRHYVPGMQFSSGAVGYHVASLEMVGLHAYNEHGWVHGLLSDGVVATLGPVAEPYLNAFPPPNEFFPLLMTGKLPLAEVYWKTEPTVSWMMCLVGDPLYTPYKVDPPLKVADLPADLRAALAAPASSAQDLDGNGR